VTALRLGMPIRCWSVYQSYPAYPNLAIRVDVDGSMHSYLSATVLGNNIQCKTIGETPLEIFDFHFGVRLCFPLTPEE